MNNGMSESATSNNTEVPLAVAAGGNAAEKGDKASDAIQEHEMDGEIMAPSADNKEHDSSAVGQAPNLSNNNVPGTPSNANNPSNLTDQQFEGTPTATPGVARAPIHPYIPFYPAVIPGFSAQPQPPTADPLLTGTGTNPYHYNDASAMNDPVPDTRRNRGGVTEPFPEKLHRMLEQTEREGRRDIVSFFSHGRAFAIHKPKKFQDEIMPRFFKQTRLTSFQRQ